MPFEFKSEFERNPTNIPAPVIKTDCEAELAMMTNFLQDNGYIMLYDTYKEIIRERERIAQLEETHNGFEEAK
jgi:hypothetical protein